MNSQYVYLDVIKDQKNWKEFSKFLFESSKETSTSNVALELKYRQK